MRLLIFTLVTLIFAPIVVSTITPGGSRASAGFPCPGRSPTALARHPRSLRLSGREIVMDGHVWQDSQPPGSNGATIRLYVRDSTLLLPSVRPIAAWVACGRSVRRFTPRLMKPRVDAGRFVEEYTLSAPPDWGPFAYDDFLVQLRDSSGHRHYLRSARSMIFAVH